MPCEDVTEILTIRLDEADRLATYGLRKRTCGRAVGESDLLLTWARARGAEEILHATSDELLDALGESPGGDLPELEFLQLKHFFALQTGLGVLLGTEAGGLADACTVHSIEHGPEGTDFAATIRVELLTERIKACGRCSGCGSKKSVAERAAAALAH